MRIQQHSVFLSQLVREVSRGVLAPAAFQRPYVWGEAEVLALCKSILAGYPLGGFLCWAPGKHADMAKVGQSRLGPLASASDSPPEKLLLDGQNRLSSIAWMLRDNSSALPTDLSEAEAKTWAAGKILVVDLGSQCVRFEDSSKAEQGFTLPSRCLFRGTDSMALVRRRWGTSWAHLDEETKNVGLGWYDKASNAFGEARVVETVLENASVGEAKEAFLHICKAGVPMTELDFDKAVSWAEGT